jgi:REP element-mobilizing transposase RayT
MREEPYLLDHASRQIVLAAIRRVCAHRGWRLIAAHVRTSHVHVVVNAGVTPERIMHAFKAYACRSLHQGTKWWTRHGSTRYLWKIEDVDGAVRYVVEGQGEAMAVFLDTAP